MSFLFVCLISFTSVFGKVIVENEFDAMLGRSLILGSAKFDNAADSGFALNGNFRHYLSDSWSVGLGYHYLDFSDVDTEDHALYLLSGYEMQYKELIPYAVGGVGFAKMNGIGGYSALAIYAGIGVRKYLQRNIKLNFAINLHHIPEKDNLNNAQTIISPMLGVTFFFDRGAKNAHIFLGHAPKDEDDDDDIEEIASLDDDHDGVNNEDDQCAKTPQGVEVNYLGCEKNKKVVISLDVKFQLGSTEVDESYTRDLDRLAVIIKKNKNLKVEIQGFTDNSGEESYNLMLSQKRAASVTHYLIEKYPASSDRIRARGYGPQKPIASNATIAGRRRNRRVEAKLIVD